MMGQGHKERKRHTEMGPNEPFQHGPSGSPQCGPNG